MAIYSFICKGCGEYFEKHFPMGECPSYTNCTCGKLGDRQYSTSSIIINGSNNASVQRNRT